MAYFGSVIVNLFFVLSLYAECRMYRALSKYCFDGFTCIICFVSGEVSPEEAFKDTETRLFLCQLGINIIT